MLGKYLMASHGSLLLEDAETKKLIGVNDVINEDLKKKHEA